MLPAFKTTRCLWFLACALAAFGPLSSASPAQPPAKAPAPPSPADETEATPRPSLSELKRTGQQRSRFSQLAVVDVPAGSQGQPPQANLRVFEATIRPLLEQHCFDCHGPDVSEGNVQIDALDPDLLHGSDTDWWTEVFAVVTKGEMPPSDAAELTQADRRKIVDWLANELQAASILRRASGSHSAFRRLTRYEYNSALQDLLGLPWDFASDLPPEPHSEEGFQNSSELLHLSVSQFETYHRLAREALDRATVVGERPQTRYWGVTMKEAAAREWPKQTAQLEKAQTELADDPEKLREELKRLEEEFRRPHPTAYYRELSSGRTAPAQWSYPGARYAFAPTETKPPFPSDYDCVAILPAHRRSHLTVELGNQLPDEGTLRVTVRASRVNPDNPKTPSLQLLFGWQASNEGRALLRVSQEDIPVTAPPDAPQLIQWDVPLGEIYPRNSVRKTSAMGATPSPSEYIRIANRSASASEVQLDFVRVEAPVYDQWPPPSHRRIFFAGDHPRDHAGDETDAAKEILLQFMTRAWRRPPTAEEVDRKLKLFTVMRSQCDRFEQAVLEVLATVLSSPQFLYVAHDASLGEPAASPPAEAPSPRSGYALATRLSLFLWCSIPDAKLRALAERGELAKPEVLSGEVERMLADPRSDRFSEHFVHQWLDMELLEFVNFKQHVGQFDPLLKEAMQREPVALFKEMLGRDATVLDFIHSDYVMVNERLAQHYGIGGVNGNHFRRVTLEGDPHRGGLLTQAGFLAMNSDWPDSHPLKRAIWLLECLLADPPPPPPPAVPQIDLADPEIAKMTLKERMEDHRNQAACRSCHAKIDPWGIAFEHYDALGQWRDEIRGQPVDASSELFNGQTLDGIDGLKRFLLEDRQDQFVRAMVQKLATFALGRPLGFDDRADIDSITAEVRREGDGLKTMIQAIVRSDLFLKD